MDRQEWLAERRVAVEAQYDAESATYDEHDYPTDTQRQWVARLLSLLPSGGTVLDAPCGTGRYFPMVAAAGLRVAGIDQSAGMLAQARARGIAFSLEQVTLQDLDHDGQFDAVMTVDAMENVPPEDWPLVVSNLRRAVWPGGLVYLTVEEVAPGEAERQFLVLRDRGTPAVPGEIIEGDVAGYHYYPGRDQAVEWLTAAGLDVIDEAYKQEEGWGYRHFLLRRPG